MMPSIAAMSMPISEKGDSALKLRGLRLFPEFGSMVVPDGRVMSHDSRSTAALPQPSVRWLSRLGIIFAPGLSGHADITGL
jgi:hypothetical protein